MSQRGVVTNTRTFFTSSSPTTHSPRLHTSSRTAHPHSTTFPTKLRPGMNPAFPPPTPLPPLPPPLPLIPDLSKTMRESSVSKPTAWTCTRTWDSGT